MKSNLRIIAPYIRKSKYLYLTGFILYLSGTYLIIEIPQLIKKLVDILCTGSFVLSDLTRPVINLVALGVIVNIIQFAGKFIITNESRKDATLLKNDLFKYVLKLPAAFFRSHHSGDILTRISNDTEIIKSFADGFFINFLNNIFLVAIITIVFSNHYPQVALFTLAPFFLILILYAFLGKIVRHIYVDVQQGFSRLTQYTQESLIGIKLIQSYGKEQAFNAKFLHMNKDYTRTNQKLSFLWSLFRPFTVLFGGLFSAFLLWKGGNLVIDGKMTPGDFTAILAYLGMLIWPVIGFTVSVNSMKQAMVSLERTGVLFNEKQENNSSVVSVRYSDKYDISIHNLTVKNNVSRILKNISVEIPQGATVGITGTVGSGKSTLISCLTGLQVVDRGSIFIGNKDLVDYDPFVLRSMFGFVTQETILFSGTIRENIAFGVSDIEDEWLLKVSEMAGIKNDILNFKNSYDTLIGERGTSLSGGQMFRISLARALAPDPLILVLDDALLSVDNNTRRLILSNIHKYRRNKTNIIISNQVHPIKDSDVIIVLHKGEVVQKGKHDELISVDGLYKNLFNIQGDAQNNS